MKTIISLTLAALGFAGIASAQDVRYNFDADTNFAKLKTYKWVDLNSPVQVDDLVARQLTSAFDAGLAAKGLTKVDSDQADVLVGYQVALQQEKQLNSYTTGGYGYGYGARWGAGMGGMTTATTTTLTVGSISLDMYEVGSKHLVWRGTASKTLDEGAKPDKRQKNIHKAVTKMLKNYPPKVKK